MSQKVGTVSRDILELELISFNDNQSLLDGDKIRAVSHYTVLAESFDSANLLEKACSAHHFTLTIEI